MAGVVTDADAMAAKIQALQEENQALCRRIGALEVRLEEEGHALVSHTGVEWRQQGVNASQSMEVFYVNIILVNDRTQPATSCRLRAMVDTRCNVELIIPRATAQKLRLVERKRLAVEGFERHTVNMIEYAPALVQLPYKDSQRWERTFTQADVTVMATDLPSFEDLSSFNQFEQTLSSEGDLQLSSDPQQVSRTIPLLGAVGLCKLGLEAKPEGGALCKTNQSLLVISFRA